MLGCEHSHCCLTVGCCFAAPHARSTTSGDRVVARHITPQAFLHAQRSTAQHVIGNSNMNHTADPASRLLPETPCLLPLAYMAQQICSAPLLQILYQTQWGSGDHQAQGQVACPLFAGGHVIVVPAHDIQFDDPAWQGLGYLQASEHQVNECHQMLCPVYSDKRHWNYAAPRLCQ